MHTRWRFAVGAGLIALAVGYLITTAVRKTAEYYMTVQQVAADEAHLKGQTLRVGGRVKPGTVSWNPATLTLAFAIVQPPHKSGTPGVDPVAVGDPPEFHVIASGEPKPDMFAPGRDVIVEGRLGPDGTIEASQVLTKCASKYVPKVPGEK